MCAVFLQIRERNWQKFKEAVIDVHIIQDQGKRRISVQLAVYRKMFPDDYDHLRVLHFVIFVNINFFQQLRIIVQSIGLRSTHRSVTSFFWK